ncbi:MAG: prephenate dehydrogenase/arogenate dehydrogenase family protein [SAR324 cluster bacterium]|nr:prephenate dehydrogenase/arogenate dehydrogenase family protein [SAR324 cluster bacterium]
MRPSSVEFPLPSLAIIGLGLIGGSLALDLKKQGIVKQVIGYDLREEHCQQALRFGIVDHASTVWDDALKQAPLVVLAVPVRSCSTVIRELRGKLSPQVVMTDVGSVKGPVMRLMASEFSDIAFVGGHPIAGSEQFGPQHARTGLFQNKMFIVTPANNTAPEHLELIRSLWERVGSRVITMDENTHDRVFSWVSHLPHLLAYGSIQTIAGADEPEILKFSGAGLKDFSRIASSSPEMWADIFLENKANLLANLNKFFAVMQNLQTAIEQDDRDGLAQLLQQAKASRDQWIR